MKRSKKWTRSNRQAVIASKRTSRVVTKTKNRDSGTLVAEAVSKRPDGLGATRLFIRDSEGQYLVLNGFEARTVYRVLSRHFDETGRTL